jgi:hypothetical protein
VASAAGADIAPRFVDMQTPAAVLDLGLGLS